MSIRDAGWLKASPFTQSIVQSPYRACLLVSLAPATFRYQAHPDDDTELSTRVRDLATRYPRYGYRRMVVAQPRAIAISRL